MLSWIWLTDLWQSSSLTCTLWVQDWDILLQSLCLVVVGQQITNRRLFPSHPSHHLQFWLKYWHIEHLKEEWTRPYGLNFSLTSLISFFTLYYTISVTFHVNSEVNTMNVFQERLSESAGFSRRHRGNFRRDQTIFCMNKFVWKPQDEDFWISKRWPNPSRT